jgi:hypothetical protein
MRPFGFFHLKGIGGQIAALVLASTVALHLVITAAFLISRPDRPETPDGAPQLADAALLLGSASPDDRPRLIADLVRAFPKLDPRRRLRARRASPMTAKAATFMASAAISARATRWCSSRPRAARTASACNCPMAP